MEIGANIISITARPGHSVKHVVVTITLEVEVLKSSYGDSKNMKAMGLTLGPCMVSQDKT